MIRMIVGAGTAGVGLASNLAIFVLAQESMTPESLGMAVLVGGGLFWWGYLAWRKARRLATAQENERQRNG